MPPRPPMIPPSESFEDWEFFSPPCFPWSLEAMAEHDEDPFVIPEHREDVTQEPEPPGSHHDPRHQDVDWIGHANQGGGYVPPDYEWSSNPKQEQDTLEGEWPEPAAP